jgi:hypothetical protein
MRDSKASGSRRTGRMSQKLTPGLGKSGWYSGRGEKERAEEGPGQQRSSGRAAKDLLTKESLEVLYVCHCE